MKACLIEFMLPVMDFAMRGSKALPPFFCIFIKIKPWLFYMRTLHNHGNDLTYRIRLSKLSFFRRVKLVIGLTGSRSRIVHLALPQNDSTQDCAEIMLVNDCLGWRLLGVASDGLVHTADYFYSPHTPKFKWAAAS